MLYDRDLVNLLTQRYNPDVSSILGKCKGQIDNH